MLGPDPPAVRPCAVAPAASFLERWSMPVMRRVLMALAAAFLLLFTTVHFNDAFARGGRGGGGMRAGGFHGGGMRAGGFHGGGMRAGYAGRGYRVAGGPRPSHPIAGRPGRP